MSEETRIDARAERASYDIAYRMWWNNRWKNRHHVKKVLDYMPIPLESIKPRWAVWHVTIETESGDVISGSMQGEAEHDLWEFSTFEPDL